MYSMNLFDMKGLGGWIDMLLDTGRWKLVKECRIRTPCSGSVACEKVEKWANFWSGEREGVHVSLCEETARMVTEADGEGERGRPTRSRSRR